MFCSDESSFSGSTASYAKAKREKMAAEVKAEEMRRAAAKASSRPIRFIHENIPGMPCYVINRQPINQVPLSWFDGLVLRTKEPVSRSNIE